MSSGDGTHWRDHAACRLTTAKLFDDVHLEETPLDRIEQAISICGGCPVAAPCLSSAVRDRDSGVRAGRLMLDGKPVPLPQRHPHRHHKTGRHAA